MRMPQTGHVRPVYRLGAYSVETVYVGSAGHLRRFKVLGPDGRFVPGGLFRTTAEADGFIAEREREARA